MTPSQASGDQIRSINPLDGTVVQVYARHGQSEAGRMLAVLREGQREWERTSLTMRTAALAKTATVLRSRAAALAELMALEMGKPVTQGRAEVEKCAWVCEYYSEHAESFLADRHVATDARRSYVTCEPLGVVLAVMPWNFPLWQVFRAAVPALAAGNTVALKHASNVPGSALAIQDVFAAAGLGEDRFATLLVGGTAAEALIGDESVAAVTLTGSTDAGRAVAAAAGRSLKKCVLELGGSDPYVILADADLELAADVCARSRLTNGGQSCISAKRFVVIESVREEFERRFVAAMQAACVGSPHDAGTDVGPMARLDLRDELAKQVDESVRAGANVLCGGQTPAGPGAFYPPTVLTDVTPTMPAFREELFGPVAAVVEARDEAHAIELANATIFGLGAAVFSRDVERAERLARSRLRAGCCFVNAAVKSDPRLPFGGIKASGYGRELGELGIHEFVNIKTVWVE